MTALGRAARAALGGAVCLLAVSRGAAQIGPTEFEPWRVAGELTVSSARYGSDGDPLGRVYRTLGFQSYGMLRLEAERRLDLWRFYRIQALTLANDSTYRSRFDGLVPERLSFLYEDGTFFVPYRAELGDSYAYFSARSLQRPFKGAQLELQRPLGRASRHSLQILLGTLNESWRDLDPFDRMMGLSYVAEVHDRARFGIHLYDLFREASDERQLDGRERLASVSAEARFGWLRQALHLEAEASHLLAKSRDPLSGERDRPGDGLYAQLTGRGPGSFSWRLRADSTSGAYRPAGSPYLIPERRSGEGHAGYRLGSGTELRGRLRWQRDAWESANPLDEWTGGLSLSGPFPVAGVAPGLVTNLDVFVDDLRSRDGRRAERAPTLNLDLYRPLGRHGTPRLRLFFQKLDDRSPLDQDQTIEEALLSYERAFRRGALSGSLSPGVLLRRIRADRASSNDVFPDFSMSLRAGPHQFRQGFGLLSQGRLGHRSVSLRLLRYHARYGFTARDHELSVEFEGFERDPSLSELTRSWRTSLSWTYRFQRRGTRTSLSGVAPPLAGDHPTSGDFAITELVPGREFPALAARLVGAGFARPSALGGTLSIETTLFDDIYQRQRLLLLERDGRLERAALYIEEYAPGSDQDFLAAHAEARQVLVERLGQPARVFDRGEATPDLASALERGDFLRLMEWQRDGYVIRFGIPRRRGARLASELQIGAAFPGETDPDWSILDLPAGGRGRERIESDR